MHTVTAAVAGQANADAALVDRARRGDADAFGMLIAARGPQLHRTACAILGSEADARDATQDTLLSAWRNLPRLRDVDRFDAWLNRSLVNRCRDHLRRRKRSMEIELGESDSTRPDTAGTGLETHAVLAAFDALRVEERHILALHHLHGFAVAEVARQLGIPLGTAKSRLWSARRSLERALEAER